jgi:hypothetical protein
VVKAARSAVELAWPAFMGTSLWMRTAMPRESSGARRACQAARRPAAQWASAVGEEERIGGIAELESDGGAGAEGDVGEGAAGIGTDAAEDVEAAGGRAEADGGIKSERAGGSGGEEGVEGMKGVGAWHGDTIRKGRAGANLSATTRVDAMA